MAKKAASLRTRFNRFIAKYPRSPVSGIWGAATGANTYAAITGTTLLGVAAGPFMPLLAAGTAFLAGGYMLIDVFENNSKDHVYRNGDNIMWGLSRDIKAAQIKSCEALVKMKSPASTKYKAELTKLKSSIKGFDDRYQITANQRAALLRSQHKTGKLQERFATATTDKQRRKLQKRIDSEARFRRDVLASKNVKPAPKQ